MKQESNKKVIACILMSAFIFSTMEVALKIGGAQFDPLQLTLLRFIIGALFLFPFAIKDLHVRRIRLSKQDYAYLGFLGVFCICVSMMFFQFGVMASNAGTAAVVFSVNPVFTMLFAHFLTEEKMDRRKAIALLISLAGIMVMMNPFHLAEGNTVKGMVFIMSSAVTFGFYSAYGKRRIQRIGGLTQTAVSFLFGSAALAVVMLFLQRPIFTGIQVNNLPSLLYIGIVVTGLGYFFYFNAIELGGAGKGSVVFFLKPVLAPIIALLILREAITIQTVVGVLVLLMGSYVNMSETSGKATRKEDNNNCNGNAIKFEGEEGQ